MTVERESHYTTVAKNKPNSPILKKTAKIKSDLANFKFEGPRALSNIK